MKTQIDPAIAAVRRVRETISRELGNDPQRIIAHYIELQESFKGELIAGPESPVPRGDGAEHAAAADRAAPGR